ncbi:MAG: cryptochrome/photolyase family protein [Terrimicrobiaceae bacterium]
MTSRNIWILGDQLTHHHSGLKLGNPKTDRVLMIESRARATHINYHKVKLAMVFAAMRHFAEELRDLGWTVDYHEVSQTPDFLSALKLHLASAKPRDFVMMEPNNFFEGEALGKIAKKLGIEIEHTAPVQFLRSREDFAAWASGKKRLLMENHYRDMRRRLGILVDPEGEPEGGSWNLDTENRKTFSDWKREGRPLPKVAEPLPHDELTRRVIAEVDTWFPDAPGEAAKLWLPVTRAQALGWLDHFVHHRLGNFGAFEDIMVANQPHLFHSVLSAPINMGLLTPLECVEAAIKAWKKGKVPLNSVEGFVRQIIGWREFVNGVYWLKMPEYAQTNGLNATRNLPDFFYTAQTDMNCLRSVLQETRETAYNHHIQRLMVLGNFFLLAGIEPAQALRWFTEMYVDSEEWVMAANVLGMSLHADGGFMATKPYAASAAYIAKMSNYCEGCHYRPTIKSGPKACPYNLLYWDFYDRHSQRFASNPRTSMMVNSWLKRPESDRKVITTEAAKFLEQLEAP